jgi:hypothetical protein
MKLKATHIATLSKFAERLDALLAGQSRRKYQPDGWMLLSIEQLDENIVSLAHYGEQNGDLMRDPEVVFVRYKIEEGPELAVPVYYRNDYGGIETGNYWDLKEGLPPISLSLISFCKSWFSSLRVQGYFSAHMQLIEGAYD